MSEPNQPAIENQFGKHFDIICVISNALVIKNEKLFNVDTIKFYEIAKIHVKKIVFKFSSFDLGVAEGGGEEEQETTILCSRFYKGPVRFKFWVLLVGP